MIFPVHHFHHCSFQNKNRNSTKKLGNERRVKTNFCSFTVVPHSDRILHHVLVHTEILTQTGSQPLSSANLKAILDKGLFGYLLSSILRAHYSRQVNLILYTAKFLH